MKWDITNNQNGSSLVMILIVIGMASILMLASAGVMSYLHADTKRINREMVDLEPLSAEDKVALRGLVERHYTETGSTVARALLDDWSRAVEEFTLVMPRDYKRVLEAIREAESTGRDVDEVVMEVANA